MCVCARQEWLNEVELTYTTGTATFNWKQTMAAVRDDDRFWLATDEDGRKKPMGWQFLQAGDGDSDDESGEDSASNFSEELGSDVRACVRACVLATQG